MEEIFSFFFFIFPPPWFFFLSFFAFFLLQRVCKRLMELFFRLVKPGGLVVVTNVSVGNPIRLCMEYLLEWNLIYRDEKGMNDLVPVSGGIAETELKSDKTGVNYFLEVRKRAIDGS